MKKIIGLVLTLCLMAVLCAAGAEGLAETLTAYAAGGTAGAEEMAGMLSALAAGGREAESDTDYEDYVPDDAIEALSEDEFYGEWVLSEVKTHDREVDIYDDLVEDGIDIRVLLTIEEGRLIWNIFGSDMAMDVEMEMADGALRATVDGEPILFYYTEDGELEMLFRGIHCDLYPSAPEEDD